MPTDKQRIDWLQRTHALLDVSCDHENPPVVKASSYHGRTVRQAIDAAMKGEMRNGRK